MLSLAPFRYRNILEKDGGPVRKVSASEAALWDGSPRFFAAASLVPALRPAEPKRLALYDDVDGGGTHPSRNMACFIAISEALERWAYYAASRGERRSEFGFDREDSTTGMAAFPAFTARPARERARHEAAERWGLLEWWQGKLPARTLALASSRAQAAEVLTPFPDTRLVILWTKCPKSGEFAYGFAGAGDIGKAVARAGVELTRNITVLERRSANPEEGPVKLMGERRLLRFSTEDGLQAFQSRLASSRALVSCPEVPETVVDAEVPGPWSRYARVWRALYPHAEPDDETELDVFMF